ncbi:uncharacterized protein LOC122029208 [Zingiber officinale]|uniref:uncharacterized protein LOC122029208 n=1 Tax=Zingiber officinale TaxID=94328 RepID=UPI001C4B23B1|nr:uncharacterized protein LOC122029208 [Zingiber officinale]
MGVQVAGTWFASTTPSQAAVFAVVVSIIGAGKRKGIVGCTFLGAGESTRLLQTRSMEVGGGRGRQPLGHGFLRRRAFGARTECFPSGGVDDGRAEEDNVEEFAQRLEESILELQQQQGNGGDTSLFSTSFCLNMSSPLSLSKQEPSTEPPWVPVRSELLDWPGQIVPASVEKKQTNARPVKKGISLIAGTSRTREAKTKHKTKPESKDESESENDDKVISELVRLVRKICRKKKATQTITKVKNGVTSYGCNQKGHYKPDCPNQKQRRKKALKATWSESSDESKTDEEEPRSFLGLTVQAYIAETESDSESESESETE